MSSTRQDAALNLNSIVETSHKIHNEFFPASVTLRDNNNMSTDFERDRAVSMQDNHTTPHMNSAQDGINAIREEQDLEDSGAYGTTPSRYDATLRKN